jgi:S-DNA-T family DNA segregation ATPase FtsK/SpoIIIE
VSLADASHFSPAALVNMSTLEQLKSDVARLTSELDAKEKAFAEKQAAATICVQETETQVHEFFRRQQAEIECAKLERIQAAKEAFSKKYAALQKAIAADSREFTYAAWDAEIWGSFDIQKKRPARELTRLGAFDACTENGSLTIPAVFPILGGKNVLIRARGSGRQNARKLLRNVAFRLLASLPPGKLQFSFIDAGGLGSIAEGISKELPDFLTIGGPLYDEQQIHDQLSRIETSIATIRTERLGIDCSTIEEYNNQSDIIEEPYWLIVIADCPFRFRRESLQQLISIAKNGPKAGIYLALMLDDAHEACKDFQVSELAETAHTIICPDLDRNVFYDDPEFREVRLLLDVPPSIALMQRITEQVSRTAATARSVKIPWAAPPMEQWWSGDSRQGLKLPLGTRAARKTQFFEIDEDLLHSALIIGKSGVGKSCLLHVLISGLATHYSPDEVSLYLLDCKQVEFKVYADRKLPHARVVAIESDREFGLSVLRHLEAEFETRKTKFAAAGLKLLSSYRNKTNEIIPRLVLIIDEFQELLLDDHLGQEAAAILDRLIRAERAFGINIILASQSLSRSALYRSTRDLIPIRIVLQCTPNESYSALSDDNDAAWLLKRPGEAIYNVANGRREGNKSFQVSWLSSTDLESLVTRINTHAASCAFQAGDPPVLFDGNFFPDMCQNMLLIECLKKRDTGKNSGKTVAWLGEPIEMKPATAADFKRQSRSNLLMIGQTVHEEQCMAMLLSAIVSIAVQRPKDKALFTVLNFSDPDTKASQLLKKRLDFFGQQIRLITREQLGQTLGDLSGELQLRTCDAMRAQNTSIFFFILGLHTDRTLRNSDFESSYSSSASTTEQKQLQSGELLARLCREGPACGIHCVIWCDTVSNFKKVFQQNEIDEFSLRVGLQMTLSDSRSLFETDAAYRLGWHRAIFFDDEKHGRLEKFRPYCLPRLEWISEVVNQLS